MGAEWPAGAALAIEQWPIRSRGFMNAVLQGSWGIGFLLSSAAYGLLYTSIGWRGLLWIGILPALTVVYVRYFVKEPPVWVENRRRQRAENREVRIPLLSIFKRGMIGNTALACWWMAGGLVTYYAINGMFATHLQKDLGLSPAMIATPIVFANLVVFLASMFWGWAGDRIGRRWAMIIPGLLGIPVAFCYMLSSDYWVIVIGYVVQGALLGRRCRRPCAIVYERAVPDRGTRHGERLLLSPGDNLRRSRTPCRHVFRLQLQSWVLDTDADRLSYRRWELVPRALPGARDKRQGNGAGPGPCLITGRSFCTHRRMVLYSSSPISAFLRHGSMNGFSLC
jgi:MFS family permease